MVILPYIVVDPCTLSLSLLSLSFFLSLFLSLSLSLSPSIYLYITLSHLSLSLSLSLFLSLSLSSLISLPPSLSLSLSLSLFLSIYFSQSILLVRGDQCVGDWFMQNKHDWFWWKRFCTRLQMKMRDSKLMVCFSFKFLSTYYFKFSSEPVFFVLLLPRVRFIIYYQLSEPYMSVLLWS